METQVKDFLASGVPPKGKLIWREQKLCQERRIGAWTKTQIGAPTKTILAGIHTTSTITIEN